jgi:hypothetical protein
MTRAPNDDNPGFLADTPEHCLGRFWLIRPGGTYQQGKDNSMLCPTCFRNLLINDDFDTI